MIDREHKLSVARQAKLLGFSRGSVYYLPRPVPDGDLALMRRIDELHLDYPFAGSRMLQGLLRGEGLEAGRLHVATLMKRWASRRSIAARTPRNQRLGTKSIPTSCAS
jgi:putative transposase